MTPLSPIVGSVKNLGDIDSEYEVFSPDRIVQGIRMMRYLRFEINKAGGNGARAEIARLGLYTYDMFGIVYHIPVSSARVSIKGILSNYELGLDDTVCKTGYTLNTDPVRGINFCSVTNPDSYTVVQGTACAIGYIQQGNTCISTGYFQELLNFQGLFTANSFTPRLHIPIGSYVEIDLNSVVQVKGLSFITGSQGTIPLQWVISGSLDGTNYYPLHTQPTDFVYPQEGTRAFYNPGIFMFGGTTPYTSSTDQILNRRDLTEGFVAKTAESESPIKYKESFIAPVYEGVTQPPLPKFQELEIKKRIRSIRIKIHKTRRPSSPFVHMSRLLFHTKSGTVPPECIQISNPQGSRKSSKNRPAVLLLTSGEERWVDYNKSELLVQFKRDILPEDLIYGFQFYIPTDSNLGALPGTWTVAGSYDGKSWFTLHEMSEPARYLGSASPVYKFLEPV